MLAVAMEGAQIPQAEIDRYKNESLDIKKYQNVALLKVNGAMVKKGNMFTKVSGLVSYNEIAAKLKALDEDVSVDTIVMQLTTPGGEVAGVSALGDIIKSIDKKTVAYIDDLGASAGYWLASQFDEIYANDTALVGSIGVITSYEKGDSEEIVVVSANAPAKHSDPSTDEGYERIKKRLTSIEAVFIEKVAAGRGVTTDKVLQDFGRGDVMIASKALEAGMIDGIASLDQVIKKYKGDSMDTLKELAQDPTANAEKLDKLFADAGIPNPYQLSAQMDELKTKLAVVEEAHNALVEENDKLKALDERALIVAFCGANRDFVSFEEEKAWLKEGKTFAEVQTTVMEKAAQDTQAHDTNAGKDADTDVMVTALSDAIRKMNEGV